MKTKQKSFVALLATLAVGTASVAGLALGATVNHGFAANAYTSITAVEDSDIQLGTNSVTLNAGEEKTFALDVANVGTYGFTWVSGAATFNFSGISVAPEEPDQPIESETEPGDDDPYEERNTHGLNEELTSFYVKVATPDTATVTVTADEATQIVFVVSYLVDTGINEFTLKADVAQTFAINSILAGEYKIELEAGNGTVSFSGVGSYVLDDEHTEYTLDLSSPATTQVTVVSANDVTLKFKLSYNETVNNIVLGANSLSIESDSTAYVVIDSIAAGYYTFAHTSGAATFTVQNNAFYLSSAEAEFTVYIGSPKTTIITVSGGTQVSFVLTYSETDPDAPTAHELEEGDTTVNATGDGVVYTFTNTKNKTRTYELTCHNTNAFIMREVQYEGYDWSDWEWIELFSGEYNNLGELIEVNEWYTYEFTLAAGESINFLMTTYDWSDDTYVVTIEQA